MGVIMGLDEHEDPLVDSAFGLSVSDVTSGELLSGASDDVMLRSKCRLQGVVALMSELVDDVFSTSSPHVGEPTNERTSLMGDTVSALSQAGVAKRMRSIAKSLVSISG